MKKTDLTKWYTSLLSGHGSLIALLLLMLAACGVQKEELNDCCMAVPVSQSTIT